MLDVEWIGCVPQPEPLRAVGTPSVGGCKGKSILFQPRLPRASARSYRAVVKGSCIPVSTGTAKSGEHDDTGPL